MKLISLALFLSIFTYIHTQDCSNPLLAQFALTGLPTPIPGADLPFCQNLQAGNTCCGADVVGTFQSNLDLLNADIQNLAGTRDLYFQELQSGFTTEYTAALTVLSNATLALDELDVSDPNIGLEIAQQSAQLIRISLGITNVSIAFNESLVAYQQARATCLLNLLEVQSSAWCLACDPNYAQNGVQADGTLAFSAGTCLQISSACYPYLSSSQQWNGLLQAKQAYQRLLDINAYLAEFQANGNTIPATVLTWDVYSTANATEDTVGIPENCTDASNCPWLCENLFPAGNLNRTLAANGVGILGGENVVFGPLGVNTTLSTGTNDTNTTTGPDNSTTPDNTTVPDNTTAPTSEWTPNIAGTGLTYSVVFDPVDVSKDENVVTADAGGNAVVSIPAPVEPVAPPPPPPADEFSDPNAVGGGA